MTAPGAAPLHIATAAWRWRTRPAVAAGGLLVVTAVVYGNPGAGRLALFCAVSAATLLAFSFLPRRPREVTLTAEGLAVDEARGRTHVPLAELSAGTLPGGARVVRSGGRPLLVSPAGARRSPGALVLREPDLDAIWEHLRAAGRLAGPDPDGPGARPTAPR